MVSELLDLHMGYLVMSSISMFFQGGLFLRKKSKKQFNKNKAT